MEMKWQVLRQYLDRIKPPRRGKFTWAAVLPAPSSIVLNHHGQLKFTAQLTLQCGCIFPLPRYLLTAKLQHHSTSQLLLGLSICHTACPCSSVLPRPSSHSSPQAPVRASTGTGSLAFCTYLASLFYYFILYLYPV